MIDPGEEWVVANILGDAMMTSLGDTTDDIASFDGNDALLMINTSSGDTLDIIGVIGEDPGLFWNLPNGTTKDTTLIRKMDVVEGTTQWTDGREQWLAIKLDSFDQLGVHNFAGCTIHPQFAYKFKPGKIKLVDQSSGRILQRNWDLGDGSMSSDSMIIHSYEQPGMYRICLELSNECDTTLLCTTLEILPDVFGVCCPDTLSVSGAPIDSGTYTANHVINMDGVLMDDANLIAGEQVKLLPGAEIKIGSILEINIAPCIERP